MAGRGDYGFSVYPELSLVPGLAYFTEAYVTGQMVSKNYPLSKRFF